MLPKTGQIRTLQSRELLILCGILLLGLFLRVLYLKEIASNPCFSTPILDASFHDYWAKGLATGNWSVPPFYNDPRVASIPYQKSPGYPLFLSVIYSFFGQDFHAVRIIQMAFGLANCILAFLLCRKWFDSTVALIFSAFISIYWIFIYFEGELYPPVLLIFLSLSLIFSLSLWTEKISLPRSLLGGVFLGIFALIRSNILLFAPVASVWLAWILFRRKSLNKFLPYFLTFAFGAVLVISPVTLRNYLVANEFSLISTNGGLNLYIGNNELSDGIKPNIPHLKEMTGSNSWTPFDYAVIVRGLERKLGKSLTFTGASSHWTKEALTYIKSHPAEFINLTLKKAALFWSPQEVSNPTVIHFDRKNSKTLRNIPGSFSAVLSLSIMGMIMLFINLKKQIRKDGPDITSYQRQYEVSILILLFVLTYFISFLPFLVSARFRVPIIPFLFLFGSYGLYGISNFAFSRDYRNTATWAAALLVLYLIVKINFIGYRPDLAQWHYYMGTTFTQSGKLGLAEKEYLKAIRIKPNFPEANNHLGAVFQNQGKTEKAIGHYKKALLLNPAYADAYSNLGAALSGQGNFIEAISYYHKAIEIKSDFPAVYLNLGIALSALGNRDDAITNFTKATRLKPDYLEAHVKLGIALGKQGNLQEAIAHFSEALQIKPDFLPALQNLEIARKLLEQQGSQ